MIERGQITRFVERHSVAWESVMAALTVVYVLVAIESDAYPSRISDKALIVLAALFIGEFSIRCWDAPSRLRYATHHWIDIVSCIPLVGALRGIRILRLLRLGAGLRVLATVQDLDAHEPRPSDTVKVVVSVVLVLWLSAAYAMWNFEQGVNPQLQSFGDALYWAAITGTGVGYGDIVPLTPQGRVIASLLAFLGLGIVGFTSSQMTLAWLNHRQARVHHQDKELADEIARLRVELAEVRDLFIAHQQAVEHDESD